MQDERLMNTSVAIFVPLAYCYNGMGQENGIFADTWKRTLRNAKNCFGIWSFEQCTTFSANTNLSIGSVSPFSFTQQIAYYRDRATLHVDVMSDSRVVPKNKP